MRRSVLVSLLVFLALLVTTLLLLRPRRPEKEPPYFSLARRVPDTLTVGVGRDTTVLAAGADGSWTVVSPVVYPADALVVEGMLKRLFPLEVLRTFPLPPEKLDTYGIRLPRGWIRAGYRGGDPPDTLLLGGFSPDGRFAYVRAGSRDEVALVEDRTLETYFLKRTLELRDTRLLPFPESRAMRLRLLGPGDEVRMDAVRGDLGWVFQVPYSGPADDEKMGEYLKSIGHMHIQGFPPEVDERQAGLEAPRAGIRIDLDTGATAGFDLGGEVPGTDGIYARRLSRTEIVEVSDRYLSILRFDSNRLRPLHPVPFGLAVVGEVTVETAGRSWTVGVASPSPGEGAARAVLGRWVTLEAKEVEQATPARLRDRGLRPPLGRLVWTSGSDTLAVVEVGRKTGDLRGLYVPEGAWGLPHQLFLAPEVVVASLWESTLAGSGAQEKPR